MTPHTLLIVGAFALLFGLLTFLPLFVSPSDEEENGHEVPPGVSYSGSSYA